MHLGNPILFLSPPFKEKKITTKEKQNFRGRLCVVYVTCKFDKPVIFGIKKKKEIKDDGC